jgi:hypothetical protein
MWGIASYAKTPGSSPANSDYMDCLCLSKSQKPLYSLKELRKPLSDTPFNEFLQTGPY